ncbi:MAG: hypothetical protein QXT34_04115 [Candidatus Aenigmatarchaeota archaeon]
MISKIESIVLEYHNGPKNLPEILKSKGFSVKYKGAKIGMMYATKNK